MWAGKHWWQEGVIRNRDGSNAKKNDLYAHQWNQQCFPLKITEEAFSLISYFTPCVFLSHYHILFLSIHVFINDGTLPPISISACYTYRSLVKKGPWALFLTLSSDKGVGRYLWHCCINHEKLPTYVYITLTFNRYCTSTYHLVQVNSI